MRRAKAILHEIVDLFDYSSYFNRLLLRIFCLFRITAAVLDGIMEGSLNAPMNVDQSTPYYICSYFLVPAV
jgi:hypothetical protein